MTPGFKPFNFLGCVSALGVENGEIPDAHITASSQLDDNNRAALARLRLQKDGPKQGGWSALYTDFGQWIQVDLGGSTRVTRVATQGKNAHDAWVVKYRLQYREDLRMNFSFVKKSVNSSAKVWFFLFVFCNIYFPATSSDIVRKTLWARGVPHENFFPACPLTLDLLSYPISC